MSDSATRKQVRTTRAIHLDYSTDMTRSEIADELGVSESTVGRYLNSEPAQEVKELLEEKAAEVREAGLAELKRQMREVGEAARNAEKPQKFYTDENGDLPPDAVREVRDAETDALMGHKLISQGIEMAPDTTERYYRRTEWREILDQAATLVGAKPPEEFAIDLDQDVDHSGEVAISITNEYIGVDEDADDLKDVDEPDPDLDAS